LGQAKGIVPKKTKEVCHSLRRENEEHALKEKHLQRKTKPLKIMESKPS
jgi:hypothetical protein